MRFVPDRSQPAEDERQRLFKGYADLPTYEDQDEVLAADSELFEVTNAGTFWREQAQDINYPPEEER